MIFLCIDIIDLEVVDCWIVSVEVGVCIMVVVMVDGEIVGYGSFNCNEFDWFCYFGEICVIVGIFVCWLGFGGVFVYEIFNVVKESGLCKVIV